LLVLVVYNEINNIPTPNSTTIIYTTELEICVHLDTDIKSLNWFTCEAVIFMTLEKCFYYHCAIFPLKRIFFSHNVKTM